MQGGSRIVIDLARPARVDKAFVVERRQRPAGRGWWSTSRRSTARPSCAPSRSRAARRSASRRRQLTPRPAAIPRPVVVIDPGHGGIDNGTRAASGEMEKTIVLEFSLMLRDRIEKTGKYRVFMTRTEDAFVALGDRVQFARGHQASLFISIHADALRRAKATPRAPPSTRSRSARRTPAPPAWPRPRTSADVIAGLDLAAQEPKDVADILIDLARRETKTFSLQFAQGMVTQLEERGQAAPASR